MKKYYAQIDCLDWPHWYMVTIYCKFLKTISC